MTLPLFVRKFIVDAAETAIAAVFVLNLIIPTSLDEAKAQAAIVGAAIIAGVVSAARRAAPGFIGWLREFLQAGE